MHENSFDRFLSEPKKNLSQDNFFLSEGNFFVNPPDKTRRINDYDSILLEEDAYKEVKDDLFKLEYKISKTEKDIKNMAGLLKVSEEIGDNVNSKIYSERLTTLQANLEQMLTEYNQRCVSARISNSFSDFIGKHIKSLISAVRKCFGSAFEFLGKRMPKKITSLLELKNTIDTLESINESVNKLISMKVPYGENIDKYKQLSQYIIKANEIQTDISNHIK